MASLTLPTAADRRTRTGAFQSERKQQMNSTSTSKMNYSGTRLEIIRILRRRFCYSLVFPWIGVLISIALSAPSGVLALISIATLAWYLYSGYQLDLAINRSKSSAWGTVLLLVAVWFIMVPYLLFSASRALGKGERAMADAEKASGGAASDLAYHGSKSAASFGASPPFTHSALTETSPNAQTLQSSIDTIQGKSAGTPREKESSLRSSHSLVESSPSKETVEKSEPQHRNSDSIPGRTSIEMRLIELERLKAQGLISEAEYRDKRHDILNSL